MKQKLKDILELIVLIVIAIIALPFVIVGWLITVLIVAPISAIIDELKGGL